MIVRARYACSSEQRQQEAGDERSSDDGAEDDRPLDRRRERAGLVGKNGADLQPRDGRADGEVAFASPEEIDRAVATAKSAFTEWRTWSLSKRSELFFRIYDLFDEHREDLAKLLTAEHGKVLSDALGEVQRGIEVIEFVCGIPTLLKGSYSEQASTGVDVYSIRQPLGVAAGITPFNFPAMVPMWMWAPAIACGNTFVLKPSEKDPSASILTAELLKEAGLPDGVFNVVHGDKVAVDALLEHPDIASISFVGSTPIARYVYENGTKAGKRVQALGGAKNHMIVLPDADIDMAADAAVSAGYGSAGERCMAISVLVAVGDAADPLVGAIRERLPKVKVGDGMDPESEMGPLVTREHRDKVASYLDSGPEQGRRSSPTVARPLRTETASSWACRCSTTSRPRWTPTATRSSARCSRSFASRPTTTPFDSSTTTRTGTASQSSRGTAESPGSSSST